MPALERGAAGRQDPRGPDGRLPGLRGDRATTRQLEAAKAATKRQIAFYGSTPAYRPVLELHGWGDLGPSSTPCPSAASGWRWAS